ncbi:hypothetical protein LPB136_05405 [Tenacibaculum todarodis]|uniref:Uncharacterized protein n=1 Tax=Tenacibaculum todarodis TaxID=1850252 RepID=A0A1L3JMV7_9FLAO|nr:hypothetical protein LPB136_05405 [Tenacibaculum todarodis]
MFNNIFFQFNKEQLNMFKEYISKLDTDYWLEHGANNTQKRKIPVTTFHQNLILVFTNQEIEELKILLDINKAKTTRIISITDIDYNLILN